MANFQQKIEELMRGDKLFTIYLKNSVQGKIVGAIAQGGGFKKNLEVIPGEDKVEFNGENVTYTQVYSDFPPAISNFPLSDIQKVE